MKKRKGPAGSSPDAPSRTEAADQDDKRPRTAFSAEQLARLKVRVSETVSFETLGSGFRQAAPEDPHLICVNASNAAFVDTRNNFVKRCV